ncbi:reverse transcriptase domain-containing protein [Acidaminococcus sp. HCP3S3_G9_1]|uniref:reverse transcriptase domain-containing protein n=1 Tax=Acidaminococcus sp. HCP3S3_G9_1 TaxID=3438732 RepID=UPI003F8E606F
MKTVKEVVTDFGNLYDAMQRCANGVRWKASTIKYLQNGLTNTEKLREELLNGSYKLGKQVEFKVFEPKERTVVAMRFRDRQIQRSLLRNYLADELTRHFIHDNAAGQIGKGPDFAIRRLKVMLGKAHRLYGERMYAYTYDIKSFFGSTRHDVAKTAIRKRVKDEWARGLVEQIIDSFPGNTGIGLGSDVAQYIELAVLDDLDHFIKEQLHVKFYVRYMDDFIIITDGKRNAANYRTAIERELGKIHLQLHPKKCRVVPVSCGFKWLGFRFRVKQSGKILVTLNKTKIYHERRKLKKMVQLARTGKIPRTTADESIRCWAAHAVRGNNHRIIGKMYDFYYGLWRKNDVQKNLDGRTTSTGRSGKQIPEGPVDPNSGPDSLHRHDERCGTADYQHNGAGN